MKQTRTDGNTKREVGIRTKVYLYFTAFTVIVLAVLWLCQVVFLSDIYKMIKTAEIKSAASTLASKIDSDDLADTASKISRSNQMCIIAANTADYSNTLISIHQPGECSVHNYDSDTVIASLYTQAKNSGGKYLQKFSFDEAEWKYTPSGGQQMKPGIDGGESIIYTVIVKNEKGNDVILVMNSVVTPVVATVKTLNIILYAVTGLLVLLEIALGLLLSGVISKPISRLNKAALAMADGHYSTHFDGRGYKETRLLADALNYAESELAKTDGLRRELVANISHDLRTPLTMIGGYSEAMRDLPGENTPENIQIIIDETDRLKKLVNEILEISKLESGTIPLKKENFNFTASVAETIERFSKLVEHDGFTIDFFADREITVFSDRTRLMQVVNNLVGNAVNYSGGDKRVIVRQSVSGGRIRLEVTDFGEGIAPDKLPLIWDRYYKGEENHKRSIGAGGLGLSIVKTTVETLGGSCGVASRVGQGSTFWFELPTE